MGRGNTMDRVFWDQEDPFPLPPPPPGGYFSTSGTDPSVRLRLKDDYDGAEPAASSVAASNLLRLAALLPGTWLPGGGC